MPNLLGHDGHNLLLHSFLLKNFRYTFPNAHTGQLPPLLDIYKAYADLMPTARRSSWKKSATRRFSLKAVILYQLYVIGTVAPAGQKIDLSRVLLNSSEIGWPTQGRNEGGAKEAHSPGAESLQGVPNDCWRRQKVPTMSQVLSSIQ